MLKLEMPQASFFLLVARKVMKNQMVGKLRDMLKDKTEGLMDILEQHDIWGAHIYCALYVSQMLRKVWQIYNFTKALIRFKEQK